MSQINFEGTDILEQLAEFDMLDPFYEAVDSDDFDKVGWIMRSAGFNREDIVLVLKLIKEADSRH